MKELMKQPSSWLPNGINLNLADEFRPFSFTEDLQLRLEELLEKNRENSKEKGNHKCGDQFESRRFQQRYRKRSSTVTSG
ncbi:MAG: hypothetical protein RLZZ176_711 [Cyanobacteriota bacterium]